MKVLIRLLFTVFTFQTQAQNSSWELILETTRQEGLEDIIENVQNDYYVLVNSINRDLKYNPGFSETKILTVAKSGVIIKEKTIINNDSSTIHARNLFAINDKFYVTGSRNIVDTDKDYDFFIATFDNSLNLMNQVSITYKDFNINTFGIPLDNSIFSLVELNGNDKVKGFTEFIKSDSDGNIIKVRRSGRHFWGAGATSMCRGLNDSTYIAFGQHIFTVDKDLENIKDDSLASNIFDVNGPVTIKNWDSQKYLMSTTQWDNTIDQQFWFIDKIFKPLQDTLLKTDDYYELAATNGTFDYYYKNSIYTSGTLNQLPVPFENNVIYITKLDSNLNVKWNKVFAFNRIYILRKVKATSDDGCMVGGYILKSQPHGLIDQDVYILKVDADGNLTSTKQNGQISWSATIYPNPSSSQLQIDIDNKYEDLKIRILDINGKEVYTSGLLIKGINSLNLNQLSNGIYVYSLMVNGKESGLSGKWIKSE